MNVPQTYCDDHFTIQTSIKSLTFIAETNNDVGCQLYLNKNFRLKNIRKSY